MLTWQTTQICLCLSRPWTFRIEKEEKSFIKRKGSVWRPETLELTRLYKIKLLKGFV